MDGLLFVSTRQRAIEIGVLRDVTSLAEDAGYLIPVGITDAVWQNCIEVPEAVTWEDDEERAWNILTELHFRLRTKMRGALVLGVPMQFDVSVEYASERFWSYELNAIVYPGDDGKPVLTVMFPGEGLI